MQSGRTSGGGAAASAGIEYQARVAAWVAVSVLAQDEVSPPWSLPQNVRLEGVWCETDQPVDDVRVSTSAGGYAFLQAKRRLDLSRRPDSELASALDQFVRQFLRGDSRSASRKPWERELDPVRDRLVLVVGPESSAAIRVHLPRLLDRLAAGIPGQEPDVIATEAERGTLEVFRDLLVVSWRRHRGLPPATEELLRVARLLRVHVLEVEPMGSAETGAKEHLRRLLVHGDQAAAAWNLLVASCLRMASLRSGAHRGRLREILEEASLPLRDESSPSSPWSAATLHRLCQATLPEQVERVSRRRYLREVFVPRHGLGLLDAFLDAESHFRVEASRLLDRLRLIALRFGLDTTGIDRLLTQERMGVEIVASSLPGIKQSFHFDTVEKVLSWAGDLIRQRLDSEFERGRYGIGRDLQGLPFLGTSEISAALEALFQARREHLSGGRARIETFWSLLPNEHPDRPERAHLANSLLIDLEALAWRCSGRCVAVVGRAGHGKTNLLCALAEDLAREYPVVLLDGQMTLSSEYDIEAHVQRWLERQSGRDSRDWMVRAAETLERSGTWMFVLIDAVNENADPGKMVQALEDFAARSRGKRIRLVISCRDILWPVFALRLQPFLWDGAPIRLDEFSSPEWKRAADLYFERFSVRCDLGPEAERLLRSPLLLSLFCQSNAGKDLGRLQDLRAVDVFDQSVRHAVARIAERGTLANPALIEDFLQRLGMAIWIRRRTTIRPSEVDVTAQEQSDPRSIFNQLRSEGILAESSAARDSPAPSALDRPFRFVYEPFAEYVMASSWSQALAGQDWSREAVSKLLQEAVEALPRFATALGALLFLGRLRNNGSELIQEALLIMAAKGDDFFARQQAAVAAAFDSLPADQIRDEGIALLGRFEALASPETKDALAPTLLRLLQDRREHPAVRSLALRLLEVDPDLLASAASRPAVYQEPAEGPVGPLPPARHHYSRDTRLTALSLLVATEPDASLGLFLEGTRKLGRLDLSTALDAFRSLDRASDRVLFPMIERHLDGAVEYRIYAAWLLRNRYGPRPAEFLLRLLTDPQTRVHRYTFQRFAERRVEEELIEAILARLDESPEVAPWHLVHLVDLLSRPARFDASSLKEGQQSRICRALAQASRHASPVVRKVAYQGLLSYPGCMELNDLRQRISADTSPSVRELFGEPGLPLFN